MRRRAPSSSRAKRSPAASRFSRHQRSIKVRTGGEPVPSSRVFTRAGRSSRAKSSASTCSPACGGDSLIRSLMQGPALFGVEAVVTIVDRLQVDHLALGQVGGLVEDEAAVVRGLEEVASSSECTRRVEVVEVRMAPWVAAVGPGYAAREDRGVAEPFCCPQTESRVSRDVLGHASASRKEK